MRYDPTRLAIDALATYRVTKLVMDDEITAELRDKAYEEIDKIKNPLLRNKLSYLLSCPWCISIYGAAFLVGLRLVAPNLANYLNTILALSAATGVLYQKI